MSSGSQVDLDWAGTDAGQGGAGAPPASAPGNGAAYLTDEEILGIEPVGSLAPTRSTVILSEAKNLSSIEGAGEDATKRDSLGKDGPQNDNQDTAAGHGSSARMPSWMTALAADPQHGGEAQQLWREHQEFRAAFASPEEARAIKELLPGGVRDVLTLREATQSVDRIDAAIFSGDARAQSEVVAEMARANPAAFRSMFAEAAKVLAGMGARGHEAGGREARISDGTIADGLSAGVTPRKDGEGWGARRAEAGGLRLEIGNDAIARSAMSDVTGGEAENRRRDAGATTAAAGTEHGARGTVPESPVTNHQSAVTNHESQTTNHQSPVTNHPSPQFDPAAYATFERATNDAVARDVRGSIGDTLARVMPEGVAEGAARRIGEDIFNEVHRALAADRALSEQVASVLRDRRFGGAEQQRVAALLAGRAKQLVPSVARRVIGEWTSTVLSTARSKAARQAAAASRVDIAAAGGSLDSMPLRQMSPREVNYASMSDEEILGI